MDKVRNILQAAIYALLFPASAMAADPGTVHCTITQICDGAGRCSAASEAVTFEFEPRKVNRDGAGTYALSYGKVKAEAEDATGVGPILWAEGRNDLQTLLVSGPREMVWHSARIGSRVSAKLRFMTCEEMK